MTRNRLYRRFSMPFLLALAAVLILAVSSSASDLKANQTETLLVLQTWHSTPIVSATRTATPTATPTPTLEAPLEGIDDWHYQLQNQNLVTLRDGAYDLLVMDYSSTGGEDGEYSAGQITGLYTPSNPKTVLAYLSIGEAENYRFYWQPQWQTGNPEFIDDANPDHPDNYAVRYWLPEWKAILVGNPTSYLNRIIEMGFDGVLLGKVDAYEFFEEKARNDAAFRSQYGNVDFRKEMVSLVQSIAQASQTKFLVIGQNAVELWEQPEYKDIVDGVAFEELYFLSSGERRPVEQIKQAEGYLRLFRQLGKLVLNVDYLDYSHQGEPSFVLQMAEVYQRATVEKNDFVPFVTNVELDTFRVNPGHEPD